MNHEAIILTQQDAKMAFSPPVWGGVAYARGASGAPNLNDALSHDADILVVTESGLDVDRATAYSSFTTAH
jgi:hypothetical protein